MDFFENKRDSCICCGIVIFVAIGLLLILILPPSQERTIILTNGNNGNETPVGCHGAIGLILAQNLTDLCDVNTPNPFAGQILEFNGSQWVNVNSATFTNETTVCSGQAGNYNLVALSSGGNCDFKNLLAGNGVSMSDNGTYIIITNTSPESTVCAGQAGNYNIVASSSGGNCTFKNFNAGTGESISSNSTYVTITNTKPESTSASNLGTGANVFKNQTGAILYFKTLLVGSGLSVINSTNTITFTNTGVISNSCSTGISCSGTNPSTFTNTGVLSITSANTQLAVNASTGNILLTPALQLLCSTTLSSANATISCNNFTAKTFLQYQVISRSNGGTGIEPAIRFNGDSGNNYTFRTSTNGAADGTQTSTSRCNLRSNASLMGTGNTEFDNGIIYNTASERKLIDSHGTNGVNTDAGTSMTRVEMGCKWSNTSAQITSITVISFSGTGNFNTGSQIIVWGYN